MGYVNLRYIHILLSNDYWNNSCCILNIIHRNKELYPVLHEIDYIRIGDMDNNHQNSSPILEILHYPLN